MYLSFEIPTAIHPVINPNVNAESQWSSSTLYKASSKLLKGDTLKILTKLGSDETELTKEKIEASTVESIEGGIELV